MFLDCIIWPSSITVIFESYNLDDGVDEDESEVMDVCRVSGYLKTFIENGMQDSITVKSLSYCSMKPF